MTKKVKVLIADDHSLVRNGLQMVFQNQSDISIVGEAENGEEVLDLIAKRKPDIVIIDISMPKLNGIEATRRIRQEYPETKVLILTIHDNQEYIYQMVRAGANGYVLKDAGKNELLAAVRALAQGDKFFSPSVSNVMVEEFIRRAQQQASDVGNNAKPRLTQRETEILRHIADGLTNSAIAEKLFLSVRTIDTHRTNIMTKLDIHDTAGLVRYAIQEGLVTLSSKS